MTRTLASAPSSNPPYVPLGKLFTLLPLRDVAFRVNLLSALPAAATAHGRVWLVLSQDSLTDPQGTVAAWFDSHMRLVQAWSYPSIRVRLYERGAQ